MVIISNLLSLHSHRCFHKFYVQFSIIFCCSNEHHSGTKHLCWPYVYFFPIATFDYADYIFWVAALFLILLLGFKGIRFSFSNYIKYFTYFFLTFNNSLCCVLSECKRGEYFIKISHSTNTLGKGMNPIILPPAMDK